MKFELILFLVTFSYEAFATTDVKNNFFNNLGNLFDIGQTLKTLGLKPNIILENEVLGFPVINTTVGPAMGSTNPESHAFYSIPFGEAPVDDLRFQPPVPAVVHDFINAAFPDNIGCYEPAESWDATYTEDCLRLTIHVPSAVDLNSLPTTPLPVLFWIYGGAFFSGSAELPLYDARWLSNSTNTIVVSANYRLGSFGFLVYRGDDEVSFEGNQGLKDQQLALRWVYDNIENFGGDKEMITIFGESAGAQSVAAHLISDNSRPFFKRAIMQSYPAVYGFFSKEEAQTKAEALLDAIGCTNENAIKCLQSASPEELSRAHFIVALSPPWNFLNIIEPYRPVIDEEFPYQPLDSFYQGLWDTDKEVIIGTLAQEGAISLFILPDDMSKLTFRILVDFLVASHNTSAVINKYLEIYEPYSYSEILSQMITDMVFVCPTRHAARSMSATSTASKHHPAVYLYVSNHTLSNSIYAFHGSELPLVFDTGPNIGYEYTEDDEIVIDMYSTFWGNFAYNGKPSDDLLVWPYYTAEQLSNPTVESWSNIRIVSPESFVEASYDNDLCNFWDSLDFYFNRTDTMST